MQAVEIETIRGGRKGKGDLYHEFLRVPAMSAGLYFLKAGANDPQKPHTEDELYFVVRGRGKLRVDKRDVPVGPASAVFVAGGEDHRFHTITEDLEILVVFAPAEGSSNR